jgi:hypothetical protein
MMIRLLAVYMLVTWPVLLPINAIGIHGGNKVAPHNQLLA